MATCKEGMKEGYLENICNLVHLEEEKGDLEILGQQEVTTGVREKGISTWNGSTGKNGEGQYNFRHRKM